MKLSLIVPCYNEEDNILPFYNEVSKTFKDQKIKVELIFINDGSKDNTIKELKKLTTNNDFEIKIIDFSRNFGKEAGMYAGFEYSKGDYIGVMDADLQDPPELLETMYNEIKSNNYDCVATRRTTRKGEPPIRSFFAKMFYKIINKISKTEMVDGARDYRLMTRQMLNAIISMKEYNRYSKGLFSFVGFNTKWLEYENIERVAGDTHWSFWKLFKYALEGITAFSTTPLVLSSIIGVLFFFIAMIIIIFIIVNTLINGNETSGWPSTICIIFMVTGIQLFCIGIIGQYLSKVYLEVKNRPIYIVKESNIENKHNF